LFISEESAALTQLIRGSSNPTTGMGAFRKEKNLLLLQGIETRYLEFSVHISNNKLSFNPVTFHWLQSG